MTITRVASIVVVVVVLCAYVTGLYLAWRALARDGANRMSRGGRWCAAGAAIWTACIGAAACLVPTGSQTSTSTDVTGSMHTSTTRVTLLQVQGSHILVVLAVPVVIAVLALVIGRRSTAFALGVLLGGCCALALLSVGIFYAPAAGALIVAGAIAPRVASPWPLPPGVQYPPPPDPALRHR